MFCCQRMWHKSCTQFLFFHIIKQNAVNDGFWYPVLSGIILQLAQLSSFKTAVTWVMFSFIFVVPGLPLDSPSLINCSSATNWLCYRVTKRFYKHFPRFCSCKSSFTTKFYHGTLFKFFSIVIYNTSTKHTILQNALILPRVDGLTSNLVYRWRRVSVTTYQIFITIAPLDSIFEAQSQNL